MKFNKIYKICFTVALAALAGLSAAEDVCAAPKSSAGQSIRDMMQRRSRGLYPEVKKQTKNKATKAVKTPVKKAAVTNADAQVKVDEEINVAASKKTSGGLFNFNSGPLIDTGSCSSNHNSGPLFDTGSCSSDHNSGPLFDAGPCERCQSGPLVDTGPCEKCEMPEKKIANYTVEYKNYVYQAVNRSCCDMAPIYLEHVDFNLSDKSDYFPYANKVGNYRFRIFGCRRYDKEAILNKGRILEKDMNFNKVFEEATSDCYNIIKLPQDICLQETPTALPEYVLTAEITDFFMNVCDGYDWKVAEKTNKRAGSAEITVEWKLTNISKTKVLWTGETTGYSDLTGGEENGEIALVEKAFADAVSNLRNKVGFEDQLMVRLTPEELAAERQALIDEEAALNPAKCQFKEEQEVAKSCQVTREEVDLTLCPIIIEQTMLVDSCAGCAGCLDCAGCEMCEPQILETQVEEPKIEEPQISEASGVFINHIKDEPTKIIENSGVKSDHLVFKNCIDENGGVISGGDCAVVDDTWIDMKSGDKIFDELCIVDRPMYDSMSPENLYKVRASVVEIKNADNKKAAGLIVSENFVLTSANIVKKDNNFYNLKTINGKELTGKAVRVNLSKNTALIMLDESTKYTPLSLNLDLPKVGQGGFLTLGVLDVDDFEDGENYIDNNGKVTGYRYSEDVGSEIMVDTFIQRVTIGGVLIDGHGTVNGLAHTGKKTEGGTDLFLPTETALRSLGLTICEKKYEKSSPWQQTVYKPVTELILKSTPRAPEEMKSEEIK